jgi:hypothetical protein
MGAFLVTTIVGMEYEYSDQSPCQLRVAKVAGKVEWGWQSTRDDS